jgi:hypothetical protein
VTTISGTLIQKTKRQESVSVRKPPAAGPAIVEIPLHAVQVPIARPLASPLNVAVRIAREPGTRSAPARPCSPRNAMRTTVLGASAHRIEVKPKPARPIVNMRRRPKWSPREPPTRSSETSESRYASTTHCCPASPMPRSRCIAGSATLTTVASRKTTVEARIVATSVSRCERVICALSRRRTAPALACAVHVFQSAKGVQRSDQGRSRTNRMPAGLSSPVRIARSSAATRSSRPASRAR